MNDIARPPVTDYQQVKENSLSPMSRQDRRWLILLRAGWVILALLLFGLYLWRIWTSDALSSVRGIAFNFIMPGGYFLTAFILFWRKSDELMGWLSATMLIFVGPYITWGLNGWVTARLPWLNTILDTIGFGAFFLFLFLFPDGRFIPRWMRWVYIACLPVGIGANSFPIFDDPTNLPTRLVMLIAIFAASLGLLAQVYRYRNHSNALQRQQSKWVIVGLTGPLISNATYILALNGILIAEPLRPGSLSQLIIAPILTLFLPVSLAFAILRYRLWDIDLLINRTLVYGTLTAATMGIYIFSVWYLGNLFQAVDQSAIAFLTTGLVAIIFQPLRERLQRAVNRLLYGERDDPYEVLARLGQRLEATLGPAAVLQVIVETIAQALKLPYVAIAFKEDDEFEVVAAYPASPPISQAGGEGKLLPGKTLPLIYQSEIIGQLILSPRSTREPFTPAEERLLADLARQVEVAAHNVRLTADLKRSRQWLVTAREEERRRIRRDLHDGLGPQLASQTLTLEAIEKLIDRDPAAAAALLKDLKLQTQLAIRDIRRLIYQLRPPALDDLGLVDALREELRHFQQSEVQICLHSPDRLPSLPAAVELAAYRIVQEAVSNTLRHAQARLCEVSLKLVNTEEPMALQVDVLDDGIGPPTGLRAGVGLHSMRERAEELGGRFWFDALPQGGSRVSAWLPLPQDEKEAG